MNSIEGSSSTATDDGEKKTSKRKAKKTAGVIGATLIQPRGEDNGPKKTETFSLWLDKDKAKSSNTAPAESKYLLSTETKEISETEIDRVARITDEEKPVVIAHIAREMAARPQPPEADEAEAPGVDGGHIFLERVADGEDPDEVSAEMLTVLDAESETLPVPESAVPDQETDDGLARFTDEATPTVPVSETPRGTEADTDAGQEDNRAALGARSTVSAGGAGGSGGSTPPPPAGGGRPPLGPTPPPGGPAFGPQPRGYNPNAAAANQPPQRVEYVDRGNEAAMFFLGGIIGYLIGRRRGRIKTEKRLLPVQKKLEKQVKNLQTDLEEKRLQIHDAAVKKARAEHWSRAETRQKLRPQATRPEQTQVEQRAVAPEANQLHGKQPAPEQIGHVLIGAEATPKHLPESESVSEQKSEHKLEKNIDTLNRAELLALSENIIVEDSSLRQVYETNLIGERGLRRLVREHIQGGNVQKALRREIVEREIDFERDPAARDHLSRGSDTGSATTLQDLLQRTHSDHDVDKEQAALFAARATHETNQQERQRHQRRVVDISIVVVVAVLTSLIITLMISRL